MADQSAKATLNDPGTDVKLHRQDTKRVCSLNSHTTDTTGRNTHHHSIRSQMLSPLPTTSTVVVADTAEIADCGKRKRYHDAEFSRDGTTTNTSGTSSTEEEYSTPAVTFARMISEVSQQSLSHLMNCKEPPLQSQVTVLPNQSKGDPTSIVIAKKPHATLQPYAMDKVCSFDMAFRIIVYVPL